MENSILVMSAVSAFVLLALLFLCGVGIVLFVLGNIGLMQRLDLDDAPSHPETRSESEDHDA